MYRASVEDNVFVEPRFLNEHLKEHILEIVKERFLDKCSPTYGYVMKIYEEIEILSNVISMANGTGSVIFRIRFSIKALLPKKGDVFNAVVQRIFHRGMFVEVENRMMVLVPVDKIKGYTFDTTENVYKNGKKKIKLGDSVSVKIYNKKFEKGRYDCIAELEN